MKKAKRLLLLFMLTAVFFVLPAGQAQAANDMIAQAKTSKVTGGKFVKKSKGLKYRYKEGRYAKNKWHEIGGRIYYFGTDGYAKKGWFTYKKNRYYAGSNSAVYHSKWRTVNGVKYYLKKNGVRAAGEWVKKSGKYYYFRSNGALAVRCQVATGGKYYFVGPDGTRKSNCWVTQKGKRYYFGKNGVRYAGKWVKYKGNYYYLGKNGAMTVNSWVGSYYVGDDGARKTDCVVDGYVLDSTGKRITAQDFSGKYLIVGDSRIVGMENALAVTDTKFIGKVSMGHSWLTSTAAPIVRTYLNKNRNLKVVFAFGVNDLGNVEQYISFYQSLMKEYPRTKFYFLSVNPVDEKKETTYGYSVKNSAIAAFNKKLKTAMGSRYINTYTYLKNNNFLTTDGLHYTNATYQLLYNYIIKRIS